MIVFSKNISALSKIVEKNFSFKNQSNAICKLQQQLSRRIQLILNNTSLSNVENF